MNPTNPIPDPIALPGPVWLFYGLLVLLFTVHALPMGVTLGGGLYAGVSAWRARRQPEYRGVWRALAASLPLATAATVTTGVAVLLFLQVLYGHLFYSAAVVIAWPWLGVVLLVILGYYGYYVHALRSATEPRLALTGLAVAGVLFVGVAFVYTNQMSLMLDLSRMHALYAADSSGLSSNLGEPTLWPRYLHMLVGAVALCGLWVAGQGAWAVSRGEEAVGRAGLRLGSRGFVWATIIESLVGLAFLHVLPHGMGMLFLGGDALATTYLAASVILAVGAVVIVGRSAAAAKPLPKIIVGGLHVVGVTLLMVLMRDEVRRATLGAAIDFSTMAVEPMWGPILIFVAMLGLGLGLLVWMVRQVARGAAATSR